MVSMMSHPEGRDTVPEKEQREGRISVRAAIGAFSVLLLYPIGLAAYWVAGDGRAPSAVVGAIEIGMMFLFFPVVLSSFTLAVAGLVYGYGGRQTKQGRLGILLSCLYLMILISVYLATKLG